MAADALAVRALVLTTLAAVACGGQRTPSEGAATPARAVPPAASARAPTVARPAGGDTPAPWFVDVTQEVGLAGFRQSNGGLDKSEIPESVGGGVAFLDHDGDGDLDVYLTNGSSLEGFPPGQDPRDALYRNDGGRFTDVTAAAGLGDTRWTCGVTVADHDADGWPDIYLTNFGPNVLYRNQGDGTFRDVTAAAGVGDPRWSTGASFFDADGDLDLDLYVANYVEFERGYVPKDTSTCQFRGVMVFYGPRGLVPSPDRFYLNEGAGRFVDRTAEAGIVDRGGFGFQPVVFDPDEDGDLDLFVSNDSTPNFLWQNDGTGRFKEAAMRAGAALNDAGRPQANMGVAVGDADGDTRQDIYVTTFDEDHNTLFRNEGGGFFMDATSVARLAEPTYRYLGWGCGFFDADLDGDVDLLSVNGHVYPQVDQLALGRAYRQRTQVFAGEGDGTFREITDAAGPGLAPARAGRGAAFGDYDDDGDVDVLIGNIDEPPTLLRNDGVPVGAWVSVRLLGAAPNRNAVGAVVTVLAGGRRQARVALSGSSFLSTSDPRLHFGLGSARRIDELQVRWHGGAVETLRDLPVGRVLTVEQGRGLAPGAP